MDINSIMTGLIPPAQLLHTMLMGLQNELGFAVKKVDMVYNRLDDRMYFEVCLPEGTPMNYADKDQFIKNNGVTDDRKALNIEVWKRYAFGDKDAIKASLVPLASNLSGEEIKKLEYVDAMVIRYNGSFELIIALSGGKKITKQIS